MFWHSMHYIPHAKWYRSQMVLSVCTSIAFRVWRVWTCPCIAFCDRQMWPISSLPLLVLCESCHLSPVLNNNIVRHQWNRILTSVEWVTKSTLFRAESNFIGEGWTAVRTWMTGDPANFGFLLWRTSVKLLSWKSYAAKVFWIIFNFESKTPS